MIGLCVEEATFLKFPWNHEMLVSQTPAEMARSEVPFPLSSPVQFSDLEDSGSPPNEGSNRLFDEVISHSARTYLS